MLAAAEVSQWRHTEKLTLLPSHLPIHPFTHPHTHRYVLENQGKFEEANRIFEQGRGQLTDEDEIDELRESQKLFKARAAAAMLEAGQASSAARATDDNDVENATESRGSRARMALGEVKATKKGTARVVRAPIPNRGGLSIASSGSAPVSSGNFTIFTDNGPAARGTTSAAPTITVAKDLPVDTATSKENVQSAGQWKRGIGTKEKTVAEIGFQVCGAPMVVPHQVSRMCVCSETASQAYLEPTSINSRKLTLLFHTPKMTTQVFTDTSTENPSEEASQLAAAPKQSFRGGFERRALGEYKPPAGVRVLRDFARERGTSRHVEGCYLGYVFQFDCTNACISCVSLYTASLKSSHPSVNHKCRK